MEHSKPESVTDQQQVRFSELRDRKITDLTAGEFYEFIKLSALVDRLEYVKNQQG